MSYDEATSSRLLEIDLGSQEIITIELDNLDPNPDDVLDLLKDGQCKVSVWAKLAVEYWRRGFLEAAERIGRAAVESFTASGKSSDLPPIHSLLANIQIARSRTAPKLLLPTAQKDILAGERVKDECFRDAAHHINDAHNAGIDGTGNNDLLFLTRGIHQLSTRAMDDAMSSFDSVLAQYPTNIVALLGKARILYARRQYPQALQNFQLVLRYNPHCQPDPRIGIGLCFWALDQKTTAKVAWQRSLELNPTNSAAQLLLGLEALNASKNENLPDVERTQSFLSGTKMLEMSFKANQKSAAAANALGELLLLKGQFERALKLAERTIQFADTLTVLTEGYIRAARAHHGQGSATLAKRFYLNAIEGQPKNVLAGIGLAQMHLKNDEMAGAIHTLDTLMQPPNPQRSPEVIVMLASLRAFSRPGISSSELAADRQRARDLYDRVVKGGTTDRRNQVIQDDLEMHLEVAKLWQDTALDRTAKALQEALRIDESDPRLLNNLGALCHLDDKLAEARENYETALTKVAGSSVSSDAEGLSTTVLYNLARVYEDQGEEALAMEAYDKLLSRHPEYVDAKLRQARMLMDANKIGEAHDLIKQALASQTSNLNLRAFYTHFLVTHNLQKAAKDFVFATLKDFDRHDTYSLCAAGWIMYHQARENKEPGRKAVDDKRLNFQRSAEFYEKALQLDPTCAFAAQGLAIVTAEDSLGSMSGGGTPEERMRNAREALEIFAKVRESINDGGVYLNMGHCYYARDELDRAIESYETASARFYGNRNPTALMCLCRSWYAKALKDLSHEAMKTGLQYAQRVYHLQPQDKSVLYNIAMIQQKIAEMLFGLPPQKRTLTDLKRAIEQALHAQKIFASLASDKSLALPYSLDLADQRRKYGDTMLRKANEHVAAQQQYEDENEAKLSAARQKRLEEKARLDALEHEKAEALAREAEKLAEERRLAREQALEWTREARQQDEEEEDRKEREKEKRARRKKARADQENGGEGEEEPSDQPKKRRRKLKKAESADGVDTPDVDMEEPDAIFSDNEGIEKPTKKRTARKRVVRDDEDEDVGAAPRKKQFKSKEMLSDTDEEME